MYVIIITNAFMRQVFAVILLHYRLLQNLMDYNNKCSFLKLRLKSLLGVSASSYKSNLDLFYIFSF